jgi:DNA-binding protein HU-beta
MRKRELAQAVAVHTEVDPRVAAQVIDGTLEVTLATVAKGEDVALSGFAKFSKVKRPARLAHNPATGEAVRVKAQDGRKDHPVEGVQRCRARRRAGAEADQAKAAAGKKAAPTKKTAASSTRAAPAAKKAAAAPTPHKTAAAAPAKTTSRTTTATRKATGAASVRRATRST